MSQKKRVLMICLGNKKLNVYNGKKKDLCSYMMFISI